MSVEAYNSWNTSLPENWERKKVFENNTGTEETRLVHMPTGGIYQNVTKDWVVAENLLLIALSHYVFAGKSLAHLYEGGKDGIQKMTEIWNTYQLSKNAPNFHLQTFAKNQLDGLKKTTESLWEAGKYGGLALLLFWDPQPYGLGIYYGTITTALAIYALYKPMGFRLQAREIFSNTDTQLPEKEIQSLTFAKTIEAFAKGTYTVTQVLKMDPVGTIDNQNFTIMKEKKKEQ